MTTSSTLTIVLRATIMHRIVAEFDSRDEAMSEAGSWAIERMQRDETKLQGGGFVNNG